MKAALKLRLSRKMKGGVNVHISWHDKTLCSINLEDGWEGTHDHLIPGHIPDLVSCPECVAAAERLGYKKVPR